MQGFNRGFTLIELSIVLVIIGLIVGGVLVGQDLIKAAELRATMTQIQKYDTAVTTFQLKFDGLPGDIAASKAAAFGLYTMAGSAGRGDNNGLIDGTELPPAAWSQEGGIFWRHLSEANLLDAHLTTAVDDEYPVDLSIIDVAKWLPLARLGRNNYINAESAYGINYYMLSDFQATINDGWVNAQPALTPIEAYSMDSKLDDGAPLSGTVQAHGTGGGSTTSFVDPPSSAAVATSGICLVGDTAGTALSDTYNRDLKNGGNTQACMLRFRFN